jgi:hypothetical protein
MRCASAVSRSRASWLAAGAPLWLLIVVALTGTLSTSVVDNGPATTLGQAMLAAEDAGTARVYGRYNAVGSATGALGSLAVILPGLKSHGVHGWLFLALVPVGIAGMVLATRLSPVACRGGRRNPGVHPGTGNPCAITTWPLPRRGAAAGGTVRRGRRGRRPGHHRLPGVLPHRALPHPGNRHDRVARSAASHPTYIPRPAADNGFRWHVAAGYLAGSSRKRQPGNGQPAVTATAGSGESEMPRRRCSMW